MPNRTFVYITHHRSMVGYLGSIPLLPKSSKHLLLALLPKNPTQLFGIQKLLNCLQEQFNKGNAFEKKLKMKKNIKIVIIGLGYVGLPLVRLFVAK